MYSVMVGHRLTHALKILFLKYSSIRLGLQHTQFSAMHLSSEQRPSQIALRLLIYVLDVS